MARTTETYYEIEATPEHRFRCTRAYATRKVVAISAARKAEARGFTVLVIRITEHSSGDVERTVEYRSAERVTEVAPFDFDHVKCTLVADAWRLPTR